MNFNKLYLALLLAGISVPTAYAEQPTPDASQANDVVQVIEVQESDIGGVSDQDVQQVEDSVDTLELVESNIQKYISNLKHKLEASNSTHKVFVYSGTGEIDVDKSNPNWAKFRAQALEEAVQNARKEYLETLNASVEDNVVSSLSYTNGLPKPTADDFRSDSAMENFVDKVVAVLNGKLDKELKDLGINPEQYKSASPSIKRDLFKESVVNQTLRSSYGDLSGMMVVKVFEEIQDSGHGSIGAVLVLSAKKRDQIKALIESDGNVPAQVEQANKKYHSIHDALMEQKDTLYLKSGTQLVYDDKGYPVILAYGQSGVTFSSSSSKKKVERKVARSFAANNAWANLSRTYNLSGDFSSRSSVEKSASESEQFELIVDSVRSKSTGLTQHLIESLDEKASMSSSLQSMTGVSSGLEWRRKHPVTGQEMVGTVLVWHPVKVSNARNLASGKSESELDAEQVKDIGGGAVSSAESEDMFDAADF